MQLEIKYYGMLAEVSACDEEMIDFDGRSISDLLELLILKYPGLASKDIKVAQNNEIMDRDRKVTSCEIALLPPFSGG